MVTRNVTHRTGGSPWGVLFARHDLDIKPLRLSLNYVPHCARKGQPDFKAARERLEINPARAYACGDEHKDYLAALAAGMRPFIVSYGFESHVRLTRKYRHPRGGHRADPGGVQRLACDTAWTCTSTRLITRGVHQDTLHPGVRASGWLESAPHPATFAAGRG
jgi:hypothetical protein